MNYWSLLACLARCFGRFCFGFSWLPRSAQGITKENHRAKCKAFGANEGPTVPKHQVFPVFSSFFLETKHKPSHSLPPAPLFLGEAKQNQVSQQNPKVRDHVGSFFWGLLGAVDLRDEGAYFATPGGSAFLSPAFCWVGGGWDIVVLNGVFCFMLGWDGFWEVLFSFYCGLATSGLF